MIKEKDMESRYILLTLVIVISFIATQSVEAFENLSPSIVSDGDMNPARSDVQRGNMASEAEPGAIGNGRPLVALVGGAMPGRADDIAADDINDIHQKVREAVRIAVDLAIANRENVPPAFRGRNEMAVSNLISLQNNLQSRMHLFHSIVEGDEDYLLGFNYEGTVGLAAEVIDMLYAVSPRLLAQYIYHECVPERDMILNREDHRAVYNNMQTAVFSPREVQDLKVLLRYAISGEGAIPILSSDFTAVSSAMRARKGYVDTIYQIPSGGTDRTGQEGKVTLRIFEIFSLALTGREEAIVRKRIAEESDKHVLLLKKEVLELAKDGRIKVTLTEDLGMIPDDFIGKEVTIADNCPAIIEGALTDDPSVLSGAASVRLSPSSLMHIKVGDLYLVSLNKNRLKKGKLQVSPIGGGYEFDGPAGKALYEKAGITLEKEEDEKPLEMRQFVTGGQLAEFLKLFNAGIGRETSPVRELEEEIIGEEDVFTDLPEAAQGLGSVSARPGGVHSAGEMEYRAELFRASVSDYLAARPDKKIVLALDSDIGARQKSQIMPIHKVADDLYRLSQMEGHPFFGRVIIERGSGAKGELMRRINERLDAKDAEKEDIFVVSNSENVKNGIFSTLQGTAWISGIDDMKGNAYDHLPVFESMTLSLMAASGADITAIKDFYDTISQQPADLEILREMIENRSFYILPRMEPFDPQRLRDIYDRQRELLIAA